MKGKEDIKRELEKLAPTLAKWKEKEIAGSEVPPGYFQSLPDDVIRRAKAEEGLFPVDAQVTTKTGQHTRQFWRWLELIPLRLALGSMAILFVGILAFWSVYSGNSGNGTFAGGLDELEESEINNYIANHINEFDMALLLEADLVGQNTMDGMMIDQLSDEELDDYLDEIIDDLDLEDLQDIL